MVEFVIYSLSPIRLQVIELLTMQYLQSLVSQLKPTIAGQFGKVALFVFLGIPVTYAQSQDPVEPYSNSEELFPDYQEPLFISDQVDRILKTHAGNILYPDDVPNIDLSDISSNFTRVYFSTLSGRTEVRFSHIEDGYHYFTSRNEVLPNRTNEFRIKGRIYEVKVEDRGFINVRDECFFELGNCDLRANPNQKYGIFDRKFLNGVWVIQRKIIGHRGATYQNLIFDKNGMTLYASKAYGSGKEGYDYDILEETEK
ncbi:hypothetical protein [Thalassospira sp. MIT121401]|uniref:hypothetical protein n=2 Tax=unclassified Thalassospira TaxID=2648997 RepID=UPI00399B1C35